MHQNLSALGQFRVKLFLGSLCIVQEVLGQQHWETGEITSIRIVSLLATVLKAGNRTEVLRCVLRTLSTKDLSNYH